MSSFLRFAGVLGLCLLIVPGPRAGEVIDVENPFQPVDVTVDGISLGRWHAQTFKPNLPYLTAVEFGGFGTNAPTFTTMPDGSTITVDIMGTAAGVVTGAPLASVSKITPLNDGFDDFMGRFVLDEPLDVSSFTNPASIGMVWSSIDPGEWGIESSGTNMDHYAEGAHLLSTSQGASWSFLGSRDMNFRTWGVSNLNDLLSVVDVENRSAVAHDFPTEAGIEFFLEFNTNQVTVTWEPTGASVIGDGSVMRLYDPAGFSSNKQYRARANE